MHDAARCANHVARKTRLFAPRGLLRVHDASNEAPACSASEAMTLAGMQRGTLETANDTGEPNEPEPLPRVTDAVVHERANLHATEQVPAHDDLARERLCRYLAHSRWRASPCVATASSFIA